MQIYVTESAGFCFGVKRAVAMAFEATQQHPGEVHTLGPIIHNPQVVEKLAKEGARTIESLDEATQGVIILRSHGAASPAVADEARARGLTVVDATCPFVKKAQVYTRRLVEEGYTVILVGDHGHPETQSVLGHAGGEVLVFENAEEYKLQRSKMKGKKVGIIAQTTQAYGQFTALVVECLKDAEEVRAYNTICDATDISQTDTLAMAERVEVMVVIGGKNSANTARLADLCRQAGKVAYHIETVDELQDGWFKDVEQVGVTAGASTPDWSINEVVERLQAIAVTQASPSNSPSHAGGK